MHKPRIKEVDIWLAFSAVYSDQRDNQLGAYYDFYLTKHLVINGEAGHSILRKIRTGKYKEKGEKLDVNDALYFKASIAYRMRLR